MIRCLDQVVIVEFIKLSKIDDIEEYWDQEVCATRNASDTDEYEINRSFEYRVTNSLVQYSDWSEKSIIDIGVGGGTEIIKFLDAGARCYGIDLTKAAISYTMERVKDYGNLIELKQASCENLEEFYDKKFDLAYSYGVIHHSADPEKCVGEINKTLKHGGKFIGMVYSDFSLCGFYLWLIYGLFRLKPFQTQKGIISKHLESPFTHSYSHKQWKRVLERNGFVVERLYKKLSIGDALRMDLNLDKFPRWLLPFYKILQRFIPVNLLLKLEGYWGLNLCFVATKK